MVEHLSFLQSILLGFVQGATEFLPISSSAHLVFAQHFLGVTLTGAVLLAFDICLHFGTLIALIIFYRRELAAMLSSFLGKPSNSSGLSVSQARHLTLMTIIGTIPAVIIGLGFKDFFDSLADDFFCAAYTLVITGFLLWFTSRVKKERFDMAHVKWWHALLIGLAQAIAILPGISRSGATIAAALYLGMNRKDSANYSFLLAIPAIAGAVILSIGDLSFLSRADLLSAAAGTLVSGIVGWFSIRWMLDIVRKGQLTWFAVYCWVAGFAAMLASWMGY